MNLEENHYHKLLSFKYSLFNSLFVIFSTSLLDIHIHYLLNRYKTNYHYNQKTICSWLCHIICIVHKMWIIQKNLSKELNEQLRVLFWLFSLFITIVSLHSDYSIQFKKLSTKFSIFWIIIIWIRHLIIALFIFIWQTLLTIEFQFNSF